jgi:ABC-2 type transport system permease protein
LLLAWVPALVLAFALSVWGLVERQSALIDKFRPMLTALLGRPVLDGPRDYRGEIWTISFHYFMAWELWLAMILVLLAGPSLISQDIRYNALPLYFSRPLRRIDYFLGKLGVIVALLGIAIVVPAFAAYLLGLAFSLDVSIVRDTAGILLASVAYGLVIAVSAGLLILALSSLSRNSRYVALFWMGIWIMTSTVSLVLVEVDREQRMHAAGARRQHWASEELLRGEIEAAKSNWRPLVSYTGNLYRIGERLLGTNEAWEKLSQLSPPAQRGPFLMQMIAAQHPWYWSAGVLLALAGLCMAVLHFSIKSVDRLK